jgi:SAM-dependent methyltransferase
MHPQFLNLLCSPETGEPLELKSDQLRPNGLVTTGMLLAASGRRYPIIQGIPRFVSAEQYASSFGYEWARWPRLQFDPENVGRPMAGHTARMWETITDVTDRGVRGKTIVEFGCGSGRFLDIVRRKGGRAVGIDISLAVESARRNFEDDPDVLIVQGDSLNPPFRNEIFDGGYTIGVLHHTPNPAAGLKSLARTIASGGWVACCVYPKGEFYDFASVARFRRWHVRLKPTFGYHPALAYAYLSAYLLSPLMAVARRIPGLSHLARYLERNLLVTLRLPDVRWSVLDIFDAITPSIASTHTKDQVCAWMTQANCVNIHRTAWCETSLVGTKA